MPNLEAYDQRRVKELFSHYFICTDLKRNRKKLLFLINRSCNKKQKQNRRKSYHHASTSPYNTQTTSTTQRTRLLPPLHSSTSPRSTTDKLIVFREIARHVSGPLDSHLVLVLDNTHLSLHRFNTSLTDIDAAMHCVICSKDRKPVNSVNPSLITFFC